MGCIVRARTYAMRCEGIRAAGWTQVVEAQCNNNATIILMTQQGKLVNKPEERHVTFQEGFAQIFGRSNQLESMG